VGKKKKGEGIGSSPLQLSGKNAQKGSRFLRRGEKRKNFFLSLRGGEGEKGRRPLSFLVVMKKRLATPSRCAARRGEKRGTEASYSP